tara:strand:+ start:367 stop:528 length:162 start_codon:yes stop_codon:yes gene_type:complete
MVPTKNDFGLAKIFLKSAIVNPRPNENIINISERGKIISIIICYISFSKANYL